MKELMRLTAASFVAAAWTVHADNYSWIPTSGTNSFQEGTNWVHTPAGVPGAADNALFAAVGTYAVAFNGAVTNAVATVGASSPGADVTFNLNSCFWKLTNSLVFGTVGTARFGGGSLEVSNAVTVNANQKLVLNGDTSIFDKTVTTSGGTVEVGGGSNVFGLVAADGSTGLTLGAPPTGGASFRLTNGTASVQGSLAAYAGALMSLEGGMLLEPAGAYGIVLEGPATVNVYTNATFDNRSGRFYFGRKNGVGTTLNILGGVVTNTGATMQIGTPYANGTTGTVNLVDGLLYSSQPVSVSGSSGMFTGSVGRIYQSGGRLLIANTLGLGFKNASVGIYTQAGGTAWCSSLTLGNSVLGQGSLGLLYLTGAGKLALVNAPAIGNAAGCTGCVYQTGGELLVSNSLFVGSAAGSYGLYSYAGGSAWINGSVFLGNATGAVGRMTIDGSSLYIRDNLNVGSGASGMGELTIAGGTLTGPASVTLGLAQGSVGRVFKTGGDLITGPIYVGNYSGATGELFISGGTLMVTNRYALFAGGNTGITGAVGKVEISGGTNSFADARIGHQSTGLLRISGGQTYLTNTVNYIFIVANMPGTSTGRLELAGGVLTMNSVQGGQGYAEALFDGGLLQCSENSSSSFFFDFDKATLTDRGAVFDTAGRSPTVAQALASETGYAGNFTKQGAGTLTLSSSANTFTGRVTVAGGVLAVSGAIYLTGGMAIDTNAVLNLSSATVRDAMTASGTVSRIDGALYLKSGGVLTNGLGAALCGGGVVTGSVVFASGSAWAHDKANYTGALKVTGSTVFQSGVTVALTGYTVEELSAGVPLVEAVGTGSLQAPGLIPVTLNGVSHPYWWAKVSNGGKTLTARVIPLGTMIRVL